MNVTMSGFTLFLMKKKILPLNIIMGAFWESVSGIIILLTGLRYGIIYILAVLISDFIMLMLCFKVKLKEFNVIEIFIGIVYFHGLAFAYTKLEYCFLGLGISNVLKNITLLFLGMIIFLISYYQKSKKKTENIQSGY